MSDWIITNMKGWCLFWHSVYTEWVYLCMVMQSVTEKSLYWFGSFANKTVLDRTATGSRCQWPNYLWQQELKSFAAASMRTVIYLVIYNRTSATDDSNGTWKHFCRNQLTAAQCDCLLIFALEILLFTYLLTLLCLSQLSRERNELSLFLNLMWSLV